MNYTILINGIILLLISNWIIGKLFFKTTVAYKKLISTTFISFAFFWSANLIFVLNNDNPRFAVSYEALVTVLVFGIFRVYFQNRR